MTIETARFIADLDPLYPDANDPTSEGDDHIRLIKGVLKSSFPNIEGQVEATADQLNKVIFTEKNYDDVVNPRPEDLREPDDVDEAIDWADDNLESRVTGNKFKDGTYDPEDPKPTPLPLDYPNDINLWDMNERLKEIEERCETPIGGLFIWFSTENPAESIGYGKWVRIGEGTILAGVGDGTDKNGIVKTINLGLNQGEYSHKLTIDEIPKHSHGYQQLNRADWVYNRVQIVEVYDGVKKTIINKTTDIVGANKYHQNLPPTIGIEIWQRTE